MHHPELVVVVVRLEEVTEDLLNRLEVVAAAP